jgi:signal peptidase I
MDGTIDKGSMIIAQEVPVGSLSVGDIITYYENIDSTTPITHQIIEVIQDQNGQDAYITKGTNNQVADPYLVNPDMILGKVVFDMPFAGSVLSFIDTNLYYIFAGAVILGAVAFLFLIPLIEQENARRHRVKAKREELWDIEGRLRMRVYGQNVDQGGYGVTEEPMPASGITEGLYPQVGDGEIINPETDAWRGQYIRDLSIEAAI